ncbi:redoxin domain-containing protein [Falsarthrobacter nasiphocae]|uniref:Thiol-disulfide isomerase/thioredoxin n=1 Tax=Falsarthrobacter nasiphocae TaxID=189863 RepID=A0AAE3YHF4_9MICC|nr:thiol-disulfide isomerase/thioredoxin [Falsarthrobacter nasiphocae]
MSAEKSIRIQGRVRASELEGRGWLNTGGAELSLEKLRGKIVLLDFWTFCCINCLHVLDELRPIEEKYSDVLVTVGVHSPKFEHEADPDALAAAVERYEIHHPVLDDPELITWQSYGARAWPTLVVVDPEGYIAASLSGEGHGGGLGRLIEELIEEHEAKGTLHRGDGPYVPAPAQSGDLRFPGKIAALPDGSYLVGDSGHHRITHLEADAQTLRQAYGSGVKGFADGDAGSVQFNEPQGVLPLPADVAAAAGYDVLVADTVNHRLRGLNTATGQVTTVAGNGVQRLIQDPGAAAREAADLADHPAVEVALSSPWDLVWSRKLGQAVVAMAGTHQIFAFEPVTGRVSLLAGTGNEGLLDGPADEAWFAQTSGLAEDADGDIWLADSETSALRVLRIDDDGAVAVETALGVGLYDFGYRDGASAEARAQHPLGVTALPDGSVAFADTYNGAVRRYEPATGTVSTLARGLAEPSDVLLEAGAAGGGEEPRLLVVETNKHAVIRVPLPKEALTVDEGAAATQRPRTPFAAGALPLTVRFAAPTGQKLDDRWGDPTQLKVSSSPEELLLGGAGTSTGLTRELSINPEVSEGVLHITARAAACDGEPGGEIPDHAACHLYQQDWGIPVTVVEPGAAEVDGELVLDLRGVN